MDIEHTLIDEDGIRGVTSNPSIFEKVVTGSSDYREMIDSLGERALDAKTGKLLWEFKTNSGITGVPSSYMVDGVQYIAVQAGWGVDAQKMVGRLNTSMKTNVQVPQGGVVWVFAVK